MAYFTQKAREERLARHGVTLLTEYADGGETRRRSSDHSVEDDVLHGVILDKQYFRREKRLLQETEFNPGISYCFVFPKLKDGRIQCPNCGAVEEQPMFRYGCPYCGTFYNLEYAEKNFGSREHSDYVVKEKLFSLKRLLLCFGPALVLALLIFYVFSRTHTSFDLVKAIAAGLLIGAIACLLSFYRRSSVTITQEGMRKKQRQDFLLPRFKEDLQKMGFSPVEFINLLHAQLGEYYFGPSSREEILDYDVLDYREQVTESAEGQPGRISLLLDMRLIRDTGTVLASRETVLKARLRAQKTGDPVLKPELNILRCPNCGSSVDLSAEKCAYCGTVTKWVSPLILESLEPAE